MILASMGLSTAVSPRKAALEAADGALKSLGPAPIDLALVFATTAWGPQLGEVLDTVAGALNPRIMAGASVSGLFAMGAGTRQNPGVAVLALSGVEVEGVLLEDLGGSEEGAGQELLEQFSRPPGPEDLVIFLADSVRLVPERIFAGSARLLGRSQAFGLGASALPGAGALVWLDGEPADGALAGLVLQGLGRPRWGVAREGRSVAGPRIVTRSRSHWIKSLDDRRAMEVFREVAEDCGIHDSDEARRQLVVSIESTCRGRESFARGDEIRDIVGLDPRQGSFSLPFDTPVGSTLTFMLKDQVAARENLEALVAAHVESSPLFGLYMAPDPGHHPATDGNGATARCLRDAFPDVPILGLQGAFPLAPGGDEGCRVLNHSSVLFLVDR